MFRFFCALVQINLVSAVLINTQANETVFLSSNPLVSKNEWNNYDLSRFTIKHKWDKKDIKNNDININVNNFNNVQNPYEKRWDIYLQIATALDNKYSSIEENDYFNKILPTMFRQVAGDPVNYYKNFNISVIDEEDANEILNNPGVSFKRLPIYSKNQIASFDLRISNNSSVDWSENKSYFDVSVNFCNFDIQGPDSVWIDQLKDAHINSDYHDHPIDKSNHDFVDANIKKIRSDDTDHRLYISDQLPFTGITKELTSLSDFLFFTKPNDALDFSSKLKISEATEDPHHLEPLFNYEQHKKSDAKVPIDLTKDSTSNNVNVFKMSRKDSITSHQSAIKPYVSQGGVVATNAGDGADHSIAPYDSKLSSRGYEDIFYGSTGLELFVKGVTTISGIFDNSYDFSVHYGEVEFDVNWNPEIFANNPD